MDFVNITPNLVCGIHNLVGLKYLTRLRVGLSHLRAHKYQHNVSDTTTKFCSCSNNVPQTTEHYLLYCPTYPLIRSVLFGQLMHYISLLTLTSPSSTCDLLLYGNPIYSFLTNKKILQSTFSFIVSSKRFELPFVFLMTDIYLFSPVDYAILCNLVRGWGSVWGRASIFVFFEPLVIIVLSLAICSMY